MLATGRGWELGAGTPVWGRGPRGGESALPFRVPPCSHPRGLIWAPCLTVPVCPLLSSGDQRTGVSPGMCGAEAAAETSEASREESLRSGREPRATAGLGGPGGTEGAAEQGDEPQIESRPRKARTPAGASVARNPKKKGLLPPVKTFPLPEGVLKVPL